MKMCIKWVFVLPDCHLYPDQEIACSFLPCWWSKPVLETLSFLRMEFTFGFIAPVTSHMQEISLGKIALLKINTWHWCKNEAGSKEWNLLCTPEFPLNRIQNISVWTSFTVLLFLIKHSNHL